MSTVVAGTRAALARARELGAERDRIFVELDDDAVLARAEEVAHAIEAGADLPLGGIRVSIKDLFDQEGRRTTAASRLLADRDPAGENSDVVQRLLDAGAILFGRTSMTEFAYSGIGINPHYGTPGNALDRNLIPGGSSSGAALSVALGLCDIAIGTDTGGSVRIPAAANGLYGFKPSQSTISRRGVHPLANRFDTVGPICHDAETLALACRVLGVATRRTDRGLSDMRLGVPAGALVNGLDEKIQAVWQETLDALRRAGVSLIEIDLSFLADAPMVARTLIASEAYALYGSALERLTEVGDPRVVKRIQYGASVSGEDVAEADRVRAKMVAAFGHALANVDALIAPTLAIAIPTRDAATADFDRLNAAMLRNTTMINIVDGCAATMPLEANGSRLDRNLMVAGSNGADGKVLDIVNELARLDWNRR